MYKMHHIRGEIGAIGYVPYENRGAVVPAPIFNQSGCGWREFGCKLFKLTFPRSVSAARRSWAWSGEVHDARHGARVRRLFRNYLLRYATADSEVATAELIFGELLANVIRYGCGVGSFHVDWRNAHPTLLVEDRGAGFQEPPQSTLADPIAETGRGLALVRALAVEMLIGNRPGGGAYVSVVLPIRRLPKAA
jgi:signal transduction histidine kinase